MTDVVTVRQLAQALGVEHAEPLPAGYTRLEYIESDGRQYIDTELKPDQNMRVRAVFDCVDTKNTIVFGARPTANKSELFFLLHAEDTDSFRDDWGSDKLLVSEGDSDFIAGPEVATATVEGAEDAVVTLKQFKVAAGKLSGGGSGGGEDWPDPLPSGYTRLEYIEGTGTQYIDTGYFPCELTRVVTAVTPTSGNSTNGVFGGRTDNNVSTFSLWCVNGVFRTDFDTNRQHVTTDVKVETGVRVEVDKDRGTTKLGSKTFKQTGMGFRAANSMHVFAVNPDSSRPRYFHGRIETFSIYESGLLEHELIPARRASDGAVGMYDTVDGVFLANSGTGAFKAGPEGGGEQPPAGLKETVLYEGDDKSGTLYFTMDYSAIRKVVVDYTTIQADTVNFTYEGEPTGSHNDGSVQVSFGSVGAGTKTLIVSDLSGQYMVTYKRIAIYEQQ